MCMSREKFTWDFSINGNNIKWKPELLSVIHIIGTYYILDKPLLVLKGILMGRHWFA